MFQQVAKFEKFFQKDPILRWARDFRSGGPPNNENQSSLKNLNRWRKNIFTLGSRGGQSIRLQTGSLRRQWQEDRSLRRWQASRCRTRARRRNVQRTWKTSQWTCSHQRARSWLDFAGQSKSALKRNYNPKFVKKIKTFCARISCQRRLAVTSLLVEFGGEFDDLAIGQTGNLNLVILENEKNKTFFRSPFHPPKMKNCPLTSAEAEK